MTDPTARRLGLFRARPRKPPKPPKPPGEREWERSAVLEPRIAPRRPELVSDGGGLPFAPSALDGPASPLDADEPAVAALLAQLRSRPSASLDGWRALARTDAEALFGHGLPPQLTTVAVRRDSRRGSWTCIGSSAGRPLRAARDGIRASSWRLDPLHAVEPAATTLRVLVTEQALAGAQRAHGRVLTPDLFVDEDELLLTIFIKPRPGFQSGGQNPETPVRVALPHAVGRRRLTDGALYLG